MTRSALELSFMKYTVLVAGNAMPTTMRIGMTVQRVSKNLLPEKVAAEYPADLRWRTIDQIMMPKTITMIAAITHSNITFRSVMRCAISVCEVWNQKRLIAAALSRRRAN